MAKKKVSKKTAPAQAEKSVDNEVSTDENPGTAHVNKKDRQARLLKRHVHDG